MIVHRNRRRSVRCGTWKREFAKKYARALRPRVSDATYLTRRFRRNGPTQKRSQYDWRVPSFRALRMTSRLPPSTTILPRDADATAGTEHGARTVGTLTRNHLRFLYGGGVLVSCALVAITILILYSMTRDYVASRYMEFAVRKHVVQLEFQLRLLGMRTLATHEEAAWTARTRAPQALIGRLDAERGRVTLHGNPHFEPIAVLADLSAGRSAASYARYLELADELGHRVGAFVKMQAQGQTVSGYMYDPQRRFLVVIPAPRGGAVESLLRTPDVHALIGSIAPDTRGLMRSVADPDADDRDSYVWLPPFYDPFQQQSVIRLVGAAFDRNRPFVLLVSNLPTQLLRSRLATAGTDEAALLVDAAGTSVFGTRAQGQRTDPLNARILDTKPSLGSDSPAVAFRNGTFVFSQSVSGTGWTLVQAFTWRTVLAALWPKLAGYGAAMLFVIGFVWAALLLLNRKVFQPAFEQSQRVAESENLNRTMVTAAPFGLALLSLQTGDVLLENQTMREYTSDTSGDEPLYHRFRSLYDASPDAPQWQTERELTITRNDGTRADLAASLVGAHYRGQAVLLCNFVDVTVRKNLERTLDEARAAADAANHAKSAFLATMSHEIRTPLNAILGNLELLDRSPLSGEQGEMLHAVTASSTALLDIISDILDFSKIESGQMTVERISFDLVGVIRQVAAIFGPVAQAKGIQFDCIVDDDLAPRYVGDPTRVRQIVANLMSNAVKFTEHGEITLELYRPPAKVDRVDNAPIAIGVSDTGTGIAAERIDSLFRPFAQADDSITRRYGGTGLGLALCKRLTDLMGGTISVTSEPGHGTTFVVTLPLQADASAELHAPGTSSDTESEPLIDAKILVVDDHAANRALLAGQLRTLGYQADLAENGHDALEKFRDSYDLVLTDLNMPVLDGYVLARTLRSRGARLPIVALTADAGTEVRARCRAAGIDDVLVKPVLLDALNKLVRRSVGIHAGPNVRTGAPALNDLAQGPLPPDVHRLLGAAVDDSLAAIRHALERDDRETVAAQLHSLCGSFAMIHEAHSADEVRSIEARVMDAEIDELTGSIDAFAARAASVLARRAPKGPTQ
nr:ATP-binding protein [Burkholderia ambifaria]